MVWVSMDTCTCSRWGLCAWGAVWRQPPGLLPLALVMLLTTSEKARVNLAPASSSMGRVQAGWKGAEGKEEEGVATILPQKAALLRPPEKWSSWILQRLFPRTPLDNPGSLFILCFYEVGAWKTVEEKVIGYTIFVCSKVCVRIYVCGQIKYEELKYIYIHMHM